MNEFTSTPPPSASHVRHTRWLVSTAALFAATLVVWSIVHSVRYGPHRAAPVSFTVERWTADVRNRTGLAMDLIANGTLINRTPRDVERLLGPPDHLYVPMTESSSAARDPLVPGFARLDPEFGSGAVAYSLGAPVVSVGALVWHSSPTPRFLIGHYRTESDARNGRAVVVDAWIDPKLPDGS